MIVLWGAGTARTLRAHWALHELGYFYKSQPVGPRTGETRSPEFQALNPKGKIPVLVDGDLVLTESAAIVTWLGDTYGGGLTPAANTRARAAYNEWLSFVQMELDAHTLYVMRKHRDLADIYGEAPAAVATAIEGFGRQVQVAEQHLRRHDYLLVDGFSGADILLSTCLSWAEAYDIELSATLKRYNQRLIERPAWQSAARINFAVSASVSA